MQCKLCNKNEADEGYELCQICMGYESKPDELYTCTQCGGSFERWKAGQVFAKKTCQACALAKRRRTIKKRRDEAAARNDTPTPTTVRDTMPPPPAAVNRNEPMKLVLDFSPYPWALRWLKEFAGKRDPGRVVVDDLALKAIPWLEDLLTGASNNG